MARPAARRPGAPGQPRPPWHPRVTYGEPVPEKAHAPGSRRQAGADLRRRLGDTVVLFGAGTRGLYAGDASNYRQVPMAWCRGPWTASWPLWPGRFGLTFGPDPSTHNRCILGGMIGNNACGLHSVAYGKTAGNVESLDVLLYDATRMQPAPARRCPQSRGAGDHTIVIADGFSCRLAQMLRRGRT